MTIGPQSPGSTGPESTEGGAAFTGQSSDDLADTVTITSVHRSRRWLTRWPVLLVLVWMALAVVDVVVIGAGGGAHKPATRSQAPVASVSRRATAPLQRSPVAAPSASQLPAPQALTPVSAEAVGPTGPASGDNPAGAYLAIDSSTATAWHTDWYRTAAFGSLQDGTGLMIDMGRTATVTSVQITLGRPPGAGLEVLTGSVPERVAMRVQATASDAGSVVTLDMLNPQPARYLLVWFTALPPDTSGTFQAYVYNVTVVGRP